MIPLETKFSFHYFANWQINYSDFKSILIHYTLQQKLLTYNLSMYVCMYIGTSSRGYFSSSGYKGQEREWGEGVFATTRVASEGCFSPKYSFRVITEWAKSLQRT